jgi:hypothetical protein
MVHRSCAEFDGKSHAAGFAQLPQIHSRAQPLANTRRKDSARLLNIKRASIAQYVNPARTRRGGVEHWAGDKFHISG